MRFFNGGYLHAFLALFLCCATNVARCQTEASSSSTTANENPSPSSQDGFGSVLSLAQLTQLLEQNKVEDFARELRNRIDKAEKIEKKTKGLQLDLQYYKAFQEQLDHILNKSSSKQVQFSEAFAKLNRARSLVNAELYDEALLLTKKCISDISDLYADQKVKPCLIMSDAKETMGLCHFYLGEPAQATTYLISALEDKKSIYGDNDHPEYLASMKLAADSLLEERRYAEAEKISQMIVKKLRVNSDEHNLDYANAITQLAAILAGLERYAESEALCIQAMMIVKKLQQHRTPLNALCQLVLADIKSHEKKYKDAEDHMIFVIQYYENSLDQKYYKIKSYEKYACILSSMNREEEAKRWKGKAEILQSSIKK